MNDPPTGPPTPPKDIAGLLAELATSPQGLETGEAADRLKRFGANTLRAGSGTTPWAVLATQFTSPLVLILLAAALISLVLGQTDEAGIIVAIVLASGGLGFQQEYGATRTVAALRQHLAVHVPVLRAGTIQQMAVTTIVPGDVVILQAGSLIPADGVLIETSQLDVDEAPLTGESFPVSKRAAVTGTAIADESRVWMGTSVRSGTGRMLAEVTGARTRYGQIADAVSRLVPENSFAKGIRDFSLMMTRLMMVIVVLVFAANLMLHRPMLDSLLFAAALAVGLTPELLPAIVTVTLARGARRMAAAGVMVKRLVSIENLGSMEVLCTDKTGTLTEGRVRLEAARSPAGSDSEAVLRLARLNAGLQTGLTNPLDQAIMAGAPDFGRDATRLDEVPYDFDRKRMSVLVGGQGGSLLVCKGAAASVLGRCTDLSAADRNAALKQVDAWGADGFRVLAVAIREMGDAGRCTLADETDLTLAGYLLFRDPPKPDVAETVAGLHRSGIALKIVTGDARAVALHVAQAVGLGHGTVLTGAEIARMNDRKLRRRAAHVSVFAEVTPDQKERIVEALKFSHRSVGYLGDGINDAPSLRVADVGISVDGAVDAAREAADIVLLKRDLEVLLDGVVLGRSAFANTLKYITVTASSNLGNMISMALASLALPFLPMLAKQILLNNFLSDLPMLAIATDNVDEERLARPGRWDFRQLLRAMVGFGIISSAFDVVTFVVLIGLFRADPARFQTGWFLESLISELAIVAVIRTRRRLWASLPGRMLIGLSLVTAALAAALPYTPLATAFGFVPLSGPLAALLVLIVLAYVAVSEAAKGYLGAPAPSVRFRWPMRRLLRRRRRAA